VLATEVVEAGVVEAEGAARIDPAAGECDCSARQASVVVEAARERRLALLAPSVAIRQAVEVQVEELAVRAHSAAAVIGRAAPLQRRPAAPPESRRASTYPSTWSTAPDTGDRPCRRR
jgi:hypothetical protein